MHLLNAIKVLKDNNERLTSANYQLRVQCKSQKAFMAAFKGALICSLCWSDCAENQSHNLWMWEQQNDMFKDAARHDPSRERVGPSDLVWDHLSRKPQAFLNPWGQQKWPLLVCGREQSLLAWIPCKVLPWGKCLARWYMPSSRLDPDPLCDSKPITVVKHHHEPSGEVGNQVEKCGTMWGSTVPAMGRL